MPSKLIITLLAVAGVGAVAIAGTALTLGTGSGKANEGAAKIEAGLPASETSEVAFELAQSSGDQPMPIEGVREINADDFGQAPDMTEAAAGPSEQGSRWGVGKEKLPPPPARACITEESYSEALLGTGCDCSCDGYAKQVAGPMVQQCDAACDIAWYGCWAPDPTASEIEDQVLSSLDAYDAEQRAIMEPIYRGQLSDSESQMSVRGGMVADRAFKWHDSRMCAH